MLTLKQIRELDGKKVNREQWKDIRHNENTKLISMMGITEKDLGVKHEVIFKDKSSIYIYL